MQGAGLLRLLRLRLDEWITIKGGWGLKDFSNFLVYLSQAYPWQPNTSKTFMTHASTLTALPSSCPVLSGQCHLIERGSEGRPKVRGGFGGIAAGCQMLVIYVVIVGRASNWFGKIRGFKPRDKLDSTGSLGWYTGSAGRFWGWPSYLVSLVRCETAREFEICGMSSQGFERLLEAV